MWFIKKLHLLLEWPTKPGEGLGEGPIGDVGYPLDISSMLPGGYTKTKFFFINWFIYKLIH